MKKYGIELGSMLFTLVEPHRGHEVAYNRWYERDHFYSGCMIGPGILAGKKWSRSYHRLYATSCPRCGSTRVNRMVPSSMGRWFTPSLQRGRPAREAPS